MTGSYNNNNNINNKTIISMAP